MINKIIWQMAVCDCIIEYKYDDAVGDIPENRTGTKVLRKGEEHDNVPDDELYTVLKQEMGEVRDAKNDIISAFPELEEPEIIFEDEMKAKAKVFYEFDADRKLIFTIPSLSAEDKVSLQQSLDAKYERPMEVQ